MKVLREHDKTHSCGPITQTAMAEVHDRTADASQHTDRADLPPKAATAPAPDTRTEAIPVLARMLRQYRVEAVTAVIALSVTLCLMTWSPNGRLENIFRVWTGLDVAVRHRDTGKVLLTGASRREAVTRHIGNIPDSDRRPTRATVLAAGPSPAPPHAEQAGKQPIEALAGADLSAENFADANFTGVCLREVRFDGADCRNAQFQFSRLEGCTFSRARLDHANLSDASLRFADLNESSCAGVDFSRADLSSANLNRCNLAGAVLQGVNFQRADLSGVTWDEQTDFKNARMQGARHVSAELRRRAEADGAFFGAAQP